MRANEREIGLNKTCPSLMRLHLIVLVIRTTGKSDLFASKLGGGVGGADARSHHFAGPPNFDRHLAKVSCSP
jgi:hypothetical protein